MVLDKNISRHVRVYLLLRNDHQKSHRLKLSNRDTSMRCSIDIHQSLLIGLFKKCGEKNDWRKKEFLSLSAWYDERIFYWSFISWHNHPSPSHDGLMNYIEVHPSYIISKRILQSIFRKLHNRQKHLRHWSFQLKQSSVVLLPLPQMMNIVVEILYLIHYDEKTGRSSTNVFNVKKPSVNYPI